MVNDHLIQAEWFTDRAVTIGGYTRRIEANCVRALVAFIEAALGRAAELARSGNGNPSLISKKDLDELFLGFARRDTRTWAAPHTKE